MNQTLLSLIVGLLAGVGGAFLVYALQDGNTAGGAGGVGGTESESVREQLADITRRLDAQGREPGTLATRRGGDASTGGGAGLLAGGSTEALESLLAKIDERVGRTVQTKLEEARAEEDEAASARGRRSRKRVSLADAARELELTGQQEDELRRIFDNTQNRLYKLLAGPDGDPEEVKREVLEAAKTPGGPQKLIPKYMPKVMGNIGEIMTIQAEREAAVQKTLGPEKTQKFNNDYSVEEDDIFGMRGGQMNFEMGADVGGR